jgi:catechol 2,3-dioxygenase-like lactoylglutathione lyase family enzyme
MPLKTCHHHGFTVSDMDESVHFYCDLLGLELIQDALRENIPSYDRILGYKDVKLRVVILKDTYESVLVELIHYLNPPSQKRQMQNHFVGSSHLAFEVDDIDGIYRRLHDSGCRFISDGVVDVVRDGKLVARSVYALDPDGISLEMFEQVGGEIDKALAGN